MSNVIKISKEFNGGIGRGLWLGREIDIPEGADPIEVFIKENELLEKAYMAMNPQIGWNGLPDRIVYSEPIPNPHIQKESTQEEPITKEQGMISLINSKYQTKKTLENLKPKIEELNNPEVTEIYNNKLKTFE